MTKKTAKAAPAKKKQTSAGFADALNTMPFSTPERLHRLTGLTSQLGEAILNLKSEVAALRHADWLRANQIDDTNQEITALKQALELTASNIRTELRGTTTVAALASISENLSGLQALVMKHEKQIAELVDSPKPPYCVNKTLAEPHSIFISFPASAKGSIAEVLRVCGVRWKE